MVRDVNGVVWVILSPKTREAEGGRREGKRDYQQPSTFEARWPLLATAGDSLTVEAYALQSHNNEHRTYLTVSFLSSSTAKTACRGTSRFCRCRIVKSKRNQGVRFPGGQDHVHNSIEGAPVAPRRLYGLQSFSIRFTLDTSRM